MSKTNKKSINYGLKILTILAFAFIFIPFDKAAATFGYGTNVPYVTTDHAGYNSLGQPREVNNPVPSVSSIYPKSTNRYSGGKTVTITGGNFVPTSIARLNGSDRPTTFIDYSHLLVQLSANDISRSEGFFITVYNGAPGGGYSNSAFFTINSVASTPTNTNNNGYNNGYDNSYNYNNTNSNGYNNSSYTNSNYTDNNYTSNTSTQNSTNSGTSNKYSTLTSNAIWGSNTFLPSGLVQWILLAIIILVIVILTRKIFGGEKEYHESPMKHA